MKFTTSFPHIAQINREIRVAGHWSMEKSAGHCAVSTLTKLNILLFIYYFRKKLAIRERFKKKILSEIKEFFDILGKNIKFL